MVTNKICAAKGCHKKVIDGCKKSKWCGEHCPCDRETRRQVRRSRSRSRSPKNGGCASCPMKRKSKSKSPNRRRRSR